MQFLSATKAPCPSAPPQTASGLFPISLRCLLAHQWCDTLSEPLIYLMVIFSPWAFGTTAPWSCWVMNGMGYALGALLAIKLSLRALTRYTPSRWDQVQDKEGKARHTGRRLKFFKQSLALLTILILEYCFISAINARSDFAPQEYSFAYHSFISWLPHSYDAQSSWFALFNYLAIGLSFWALCDWLVGKTERELRRERSGEDPSAESHGRRLPERLRRLLWVLTINGGLLGLEGIAQRLSGSSQLLFVLQPQVNPAGIDQFGPYPYRSNACQYFGLLWPLCLGFWWTQQRARKAGFASHHLILICAMIMALCPLISTSRMGLFVTLPGLVIAGAIIWRARHSGPGVKKAILLSLGAVVLAGFCLGWDKLAPRLDMDSLESSLESRNAIYDIAQTMADEHPVYGTGPGTFEPLFSIYRTDPSDDWFAQAHNDWLQTLVTFGWTGSLLIGSAFLLVLLRWFSAGGINGGRRLPLFIGLGLAGCLAHARYDFPFQIYSVLFLFVVLCAILFSLSRRPGI